jgi:hypothetical protein
MLQRDNVHPFKQIHQKSTLGAAELRKRYEGMTSFVFFAEELFSENFKFRFQL